MVKKLVRRGILATISLYLMLYLVPFVSATNTTSIIGGAGTAAGPLNLLVSLGIENVPGVSADLALVYYRWICFCLVAWVAATADKKSSTIFCILATGMSALFAWWGWFTTMTINYSTGTSTLNPAGPWGLVILCALLSVVSYMTEKKKENYGVSSSGDPLVQIFVFLLLFQGTIGLINGAVIWPPGTTIPTPTYCSGVNFGNCQVNGATQLQNLATTTQTSSILGQAAAVLSTLGEAAWNSIILIVQIAVSLAFIGIVLLMSYPWISLSTPAVALLSLFQLFVWFMYVLWIARIFGKVPFGELRI